MAEHSPTPWKYKPNGYGFDVEDANGRIIASETTLDIPIQTRIGNAEYFKHAVRCVNMHDPLVAALEWALIRVGDTSYEALKNPDGFKQQYNLAQALLAKAKGES